MNCCVLPLAMVAVAGVTAIETRVAGVTVIVAVPLMVPLVTVMTGVPTALAVARPVVVMVAPVVELHVAVVKAAVVPSL